MFVLINIQKQRDKHMDLLKNEGYPLLYSIILPNRMIEKMAHSHTCSSILHQILLRQSVEKNDSEHCYKGRDHSKEQEEG